jgi:hypothetical protein
VSRVLDARIGVKPNSLLRHGVQTLALRGPEGRSMSKQPDALTADNMDAPEDIEAYRYVRLHVPVARDRGMARSGKVRP